MLQAQIKSGAEFITNTWEPGKDRLMLVLPYNATGGLAPGVGLGCIVLTYISQKFSVESHTQ